MSNENVKTVKRHYLQTKEGRRNVINCVIAVLIGGRKIFCVYGKNSSLIRNRYV